MACLSIAAITLALPHPFTNLATPTRQVYRIALGKWRVDSLGNAR